MMFLASANPLEHSLDRPFGWFGRGVGEALAAVGITTQVFMLFIGAALMCAVFIARARRVQAGELVPHGWGNFLEALLLFIRDEVVRPVVGRDGDRYLPFIWTVFFLILTCNLLGLIPGCMTATGNISVNAALAGVSFLAWHLWGIRSVGVVKYLRYIVPPVPLVLWPLMLVIEIVGHFVRPFALTMRLFANMFAGHIAIATVLGFTAALTKDTLVLGGAISLAGVLGAVALTLFEVFVAALQAFIFASLTTVFVGMSVHPEH
ncbi:MAG TPA: F0F1 ATP synthase subunit A [Planctomycetota bacterium]|jgi:F-type H+-transporting ATPase subunit a|nr:F0F1 ATP synthase subunit A [Planctomycetota bacterium]OQC21212.1 MAG: ATP synthase subunit a [Planctomycetes bacterium ADurb.Bin069]NMD34410.1 F0F1 ATP synthase subunit A [Planctomycetota bacterium]HNR99111.1 F0F1 ATP synthase subunit A [Planctomycetota bacterium]HNU25852.1 F0F1 ATP synthase subunit A [Planctomycetota bacterium]